MANETMMDSSATELELLEFKIGNNCYGINVAKIKEILPYQKITPVPNSHPYVEGIVMPRDMLITLVDLAEALNQPPSENPQNDMLIVAGFAFLTLAFHVHSVVGIHRISWTDITKPDDTINDYNSVATGIVKIDNRLIILLDFERIIAEINPELSLRTEDMEEIEERDRSNKKILVAEDSMLLAKLMKECLSGAGYADIVRVNNGRDAWALLEKYKEKGRADDFDCIITDIEMPFMDGYQLTKLIKNDDVYSKKPVVIFSSIINEDMKKKGESVGANAQLTKPDIGSLVRTIDELIL